MDPRAGAELGEAVVADPVKPTLSWFGTTFLRWRKEPNTEGSGGGNVGEQEASVATETSPLLPRN